MIHTARQLVEEAVEGLGVLQVDLINAFNLVDREAAFKEVEKYFPDCLQWVLTCYGVEAKLLLGGLSDLEQYRFSPRLPSGWSPFLPGPTAHY